MDTRKALKETFEHYDEELANLEDVIEDIIKIIDEEARYQVDNVLNVIEEEFERLQENIEYCRKEHA